MLDHKALDEIDAKARKFEMLAHALVGLSDRQIHILLNADIDTVCEAYSIARKMPGHYDTVNGVPVAARMAEILRRYEERNDDGS